MTSPPPDPAIHLQREKHRAHRRPTQTPCLRHLPLERAPLPPQRAFRQRGGDMCRAAPAVASAAADRPVHLRSRSCWRGRRRAMAGMGEAAASSQAACPCASAKYRSAASQRGLALPSAIGSRCGSAASIYFGLAGAAGRCQPAAAPRAAHPRTTRQHNIITTLYWALPLPLTTKCPTLRNVDSIFICISLHRSQPPFLAGVGCTCIVLDAK